MCGVLKLVRELSIFIDESGDFGPLEAHSPFYILGLVFHDQSTDLTGPLNRIHEALLARGFSADHAIHTGPLIRREHDYRWRDVSARRSMFRLIVGFLQVCPISQTTWVFGKDKLSDADQLVSTISWRLGTFIRTNYDYFSGWDRIVIYYDNGQKELTNIVNSVFNAHLANVEVRKVIPSEYSLFQVADMCCTLALLRAKIETPGLGLSSSEEDFFSTNKQSAQRALKKGYFKTMDRKQFTAPS